MLRRLSVLLAPVVSTAALAGGASAAGGPGGTLDQAIAAGWDCNPAILIGGYRHCAPPGKPSVADLVGATGVYVDVPSMVLRVFAPDGSFAGTESLRRADLYQGQTCLQDSLVTWDFLPFGAGYYACHHFDT